MSAIENEDDDQGQATAPAQTWKAARPTSKRGRVALLMQANPEAEPDAVIDMIVAEVGMTKGEARSFYVWCVDNGFGPGKSLPKVKRVSLGGSKSGSTVTLPKVPFVSNDDKKAAAAGLAAFAASRGERADTRRALMDRLKHLRQENGEGDGEGAPVATDEVEQVDA